MPSNVTDPISIARNNTFSMWFAMSGGLRLDQEVPGTGQGLAIALDIIKAYRGSLTFETFKPHGFKASVVFPNAGEDARRHTANRKEAAA